MIPKFLTQNYSIRKHFFLVPKFTLRVVGFYPENKPWWVNIWALLTFLILTYGCYAEFYYGVYYISIDVMRSLDALCPVASSIMSLFKICCIWWYRHDLERLIERLRVLTEAQGGAVKDNIKRNLFTWATRMSALVFFLGMATSTSYTVRATLMNVMRYFKGMDIVYETPFKMMFPDPLLSMPIYPITFIISHFHGYITVCGFASADSLFLSFCLYFTALMKCLQRDLIDVLTDKSHGLNNEQLTEDEVCDQLSEIIKRHNEIADLVDQFSAVMVGISLGHFVTSGIIIGTSVIDMLLFSDYGIMVYVVYTSCVVFELFLYCLGGTALMESSSDVAFIAYSGQWYMRSVRVQKMVLLIILRSQRSLVIKVPFFAPSLPALTSILRFVGSLVALAKSFI